MKGLLGALFLVAAAGCWDRHARPIVTGNAVGDVVIGKAAPARARHRALQTESREDENGDQYDWISLHVASTLIHAEIYGGNVFRISIDEPALLTQDGVGVGADALALMKMNSTIHPEIGPGSTIFLVPTNPCGISYETDAEVPNGIPKVLTRDSAASFLPKATVTRILVFGCTK